MKNLAAMGAYRLSYYFKNYNGGALIEQYKGMVTDDITLEELNILEENYIEFLRTEYNSMVRAISLELVNGAAELLHFLQQIPQKRIANL